MRWCLGRFAAVFLFLLQGVALPQFAHAGSKSESGMPAGMPVALQEALQVSLEADDDGEAVSSAVEARFVAGFNEEFPDLRLGRPGSRKRFRLRKELSGPTRVFYAGGPGPQTIEQIEALKADGWRDGSYRIVTLVRNEASLHALGEHLLGVEDVFYVRDERPYPGFLDYLWAHPANFYLDAAGRLESFRIGDRPPVTR